MFVSISMMIFMHARVQLVYRHTRVCIKSEMYEEKLLLSWFPCVVSAKVQHSRSIQLELIHRYSLLVVFISSSRSGGGKDPEAMQRKPRLRRPSPCFHPLMCLSGPVQEKIFQIHKAISPFRSPTCLTGCESSPGAGRHHHFFRADELSPRQVHGLDGILERKHAGLCPISSFVSEIAEPPPCFTRSSPNLEFVSGTVSIFLICPDLMVLAEKAIRNSFSSSCDNIKKALILQPELDASH